MNDQIGPPRPHIIESEIGDEISLYDPTTERVVVLNTTASDVWRLADGEHTVPEVVAMLARAYQVDPASIRDEVQSTVERLIEEQLLEGGEK
jgi:Coenzyme PQQ synthesis protein D (PqqD)